MDVHPPQNGAIGSAPWPHDGNSGETDRRSFTARTAAAAFAVAVAALAAFASGQAFLRQTQYRIWGTVLTVHGKFLFQGVKVVSDHSFCAGHGCGKSPDICNTNMGPQ